MKKILMAAIVLTAALILIQACTKKEEMTKEKSINLYSSTTPDPVEAKIIKFIDRMDLVREDANYPGSDDWNYSEDSTLWYIEAALNYDYAYPHEKRSKLKLDSMYITIDKSTDGTVNIEEMQEKTDLILDTLTIKFNSILTEKKHLVSVDCKFEASNINTVDLVIYYYFGSYNVTLPDGDWVITGGELGNGGICGTNTFLNYDGTNKLEQEIFNANPIHQTDVGFTNVSNTTQQVGNYIVIDQTFNYYPCEEWVLYWQKEFNPNNMLSCLGVSFMNVYEDNMIQTLDSYQLATQRTSIVVDIYWTFKLIQIGGIYPYENMYEPIITTGIAYPRIYFPKNTFIQ